MTGPSSKSPAQHADRPSHKVVSPNGHWAWKSGVNAPHALKVGNIVYVGGQLSLDRQGDVLGAGNIEIQTRNAFENMVAVLAAAGATMKDLAKLHTYYVYGGEGHAVTEYWERMTRVRLNYLPTPGPAATALRVAGMPRKDILIGIDGIAVIGGDRQRIMPAQSWDWSIPTPFSQGWKIDNRIFLGGQISADSRGRATAVGDVVAQTKNILEFVHRVLRGGGGDWTDLATLKICFGHSGSAEESRALNAKILDVVRKTIPEPRPALTAFGVEFVYEGLLLEIDGIAVLGGRKKLVPAKMETGSFSADFAQAWKTGAEIYIGGVFARGDGSLRAQAEASLHKLGETLAAADAHYRDLVKVTVFFVADRHDPTGSRGHQTLADVLGRYLQSPGPAITMVQVPVLPEPGQLFQIDGIAVTGES